MVVPRDPPPLYTWEVLPSLYPPLDRPRASRWRLRPAVAIALAAVTVAAVVLGGLLLAYGHAATGPASFAVSGVVEKDVGGVAYAAGGARVILSDASGTLPPTIVGSDGRFLFTGVPTGGVVLNISLAGYAPLNLSTFVSPVYNAGATGLTVVLYPGSESNGSSVALAPFPNLESFLAAIDGGAVLLEVAALVAGIGAFAAVRPEYRTAGVLGGGAGIAVPAVVYFLGLAPAFPVVAAGAGVVAGFGLFALGASAVELYRAGGPVGAS